MMFYLYVQQNQWIVVTLLGGASLMLLFCLLYWAMWRPRQEETEREHRISIEGPVSFVQWVLSFTPWAIIIIVLASVFFSITHLLGAAKALPNW